MIRLATTTDLDAIMKIINDTIAIMKTQNNTQWDENYPTREGFFDDIISNTLFVEEENGAIAGFICINTIEPKEYDTLCWKGNTTSFVIHRMAVAPAFRRKGIGHKLITFAEMLAKKEGILFLKTDTYSNNPNMNALFVKTGFQKVGEMSFLGKPYPFFCYEKQLFS